LINLPISLKIKLLKQSEFTYKLIIFLFAVLLTSHEPLKNFLVAFEKGMILHFLGRENIDDNDG
jgi:hypothetical protein